MLKILQSNWISALIGGVLFIATLVLVWKPPVNAQKPARSASTASTNESRFELTFGQTNTPSWDYRNPDVEELVKELQSGKTQMAQRAAQLDELAARLRSERVEINQITQNSFCFQSKFTGKVLRSSLQYSRYHRSCRGGRDRAGEHDHRSD